MAVATWRLDRIASIRDSRVVRNLRGHTYHINDVAYNQDGSLLASAGEDHTVRLWNMASGREIRRFDTFEDGIDSKAFSPNGRCLVTTEANSGVTVWDVETGTLEETSSKSIPFVKSATFSPDGEAVAAGTNNRIFVGKPFNLEFNQATTREGASIKMFPGVQPRHKPACKACKGR